MKPILNLSWACAVSALVTMIIGHLDPGRLSMVSDAISTYAVEAPLGGFIQASILLSALALFLVGLLVSRYGIFGPGVLAQVVLFLSGAATAGLVLIARFKETAPTLSALKTAGLTAIRIQSFHDAGFFLFFNSAIYLAVALGVLVALSSGKRMRRAVGIAVAVMGPLAHVVMRDPWPGYFGLHGTTVGAHERAALFCLWLAVVLALTMVTAASRARAEGDAAPELARVTDVE